MDEVLKHALTLEDPEAFYAKLKGQTLLTAEVAATPHPQH
jgi:hypothetical protein